VSTCDGIVGYFGLSISPSSGALSALTRLIQPALRGDPSMLARLRCLPFDFGEFIDSNDQNKGHSYAFILYRNLASWVPVGGSPEGSCVKIVMKSICSRDDTMRFR
jgi:hypothetical protein